MVGGSLCVDLVEEVLVWDIVDGKFFMGEFGVSDVGHIIVVVVVGVSVFLCFFSLVFICF